MITKQALIAAAKAAQAANPARPLLAAALGAVGAQLESSDPPWWQAASAAWPQRHFDTADEALLLIWAAMHDQALSGHALGAELPSCFGTPTGKLADAVTRFLQAPPTEFILSLTTRLYRRHASYWASRWVEPARLFFSRRELPFYLLELRSCGGLGACADLITPRKKKKSFDSELVEARVALDDAILDLRKDSDAKWLIACCGPDDIAGIKDAARWTRRLRGLLEADAAVVQGASCALALTPAFVAKNIPVAEDSGLLIFSSRFAASLPAGPRETASLAMAQALRPWGDRALWVDIERSKADAWTEELHVGRGREKGFSWHCFSRTQTTAAASQSAADDAKNAAFLS